MTGIETGLLLGISAAVSAVGAGIGAISSIAQGKAASDAAKFNRDLALRNATLARQQAATAAEAQNRDSRRRLGQIRATIGGQGIQVEGSPLDLLASSASEAELDRLTIIHKGELKATGFLDEAQVRGREAKTAFADGLVGGATQFVSGVGSAIGNFGAAIDTS